MPEEALLKAIEEDARSQSRRMVEEAEEEASTLVRRAGEEAEKARAERLSALAEAVAKRRASMVGGARVRARSLVAEAELGLVDEVITAAMEEIKRLPEEEHRRIIKAFYEELMREWKGEREDAPIVHVNPEDMRFMEGGANPDPEVSGGVVFTSPDGRLRFENTFSSRIKRGRERVIEELHKILFPEAHGHGAQLL